MKKSKFKSVLGGTAECMKRLAIATKGCGQLTSNDAYFVDSWFSSVKTAEEMAAAGVDYCGPVKTSQKGFCLATLEKLMKDWPGGSYLLLKSTPIFPGEKTTPGHWVQWPRVDFHQEILEYSSKQDMTLPANLSSTFLT